MVTPGSPKAVCTASAHWRRSKGAISGSDEANVIGAIDFNNLTAFVNEPRMYGVELTKRF